MNGLCKFLAVTVVVIAVSGCTPPNGSIDSAGDQLLAVPYRVAYEVNDLFLRYEDLSVFASLRGALMSIPVDQVSIAIAEDPYLPDVLTPVALDEDYLFFSGGRKLVIVTYKKLSARYSVEVRDPYSVGENGNGSSSNSGIGVVWWDDPPPSVP